MSFCAIAPVAMTNIAAEKSSFLFIILKNLKLILGDNLASVFCLQTYDIAHYRMFNNDFAVFEFV